MKMFRARFMLGRHFRNDYVMCLVDCTVFFAISVDVVSNYIPFAIGYGGICAVYTRDICRHSVRAFLFNVAKHLPTLTMAAHLPLLL